MSYLLSDALDYVHSVPVWIQLIKASVLLFFFFFKEHFTFTVAKLCFSSKYRILFTARPRKYFIKINKKTLNLSLTILFTYLKIILL